MPIRPVESNAGVRDRDRAAQRRQRETTDRHRHTDRQSVHYILIYLLIIECFLQLLFLTSLQNLQSAFTQTLGLYSIQLYSPGVVVELDGADGQRCLDVHAVNY